MTAADKLKAADKKMKSAWKKFIDGPTTESKRLKDRAIAKFAVLLRNYNAKLPIHKRIGSWEVAGL